MKLFAEVSIGLLGLFFVALVVLVWIDNQIAKNVATSITTWPLRKLIISLLFVIWLGWLIASHRIKNKGDKN